MREQRNAITGLMKLDTQSGLFNTPWRYRIGMKNGDDLEATWRATMDLRVALSLRVRGRSPSGWGMR